MTGGYDAALSEILGWDFQKKVQQETETAEGGLYMGLYRSIAIHSYVW